MPDFRILESFGLKNLFPGVLKIKGFAFPRLLLRKAQPFLIWNQKITTPILQ